MPRLVVGAPRSGEGKTTVTLGLMSALRRRGLSVQGYKVGPDYLDAGYQRYASGRHGRNLDLFMMGRSAVCNALAGETADIAVIEGVMGLFDGHRDGTVATSTADVARLVEAPVILVIDASRLAASAGAIAHGFATFDRTVRMSGVVLNRWSAARSKTAVEDALSSAGVEALGYLPAADHLELPCRHLGLVVADELSRKVESVMERLAAHVEEHIDLDRLVETARSAASLDAVATTAADDTASGLPRPRIAVARDDAFAFYYTDNFDLLRSHGAELIFFSPLTAVELPACDGLYLGGGYPELHAAALSANDGFRASLAAAIAGGLPTYAECGGLLYLCDSLVDLDGKEWPLVGAVPGRAAMHERLQGMGYREARLARDSLLGRAGTVVRGHEFHYSSCALHDPTSAAYELDGLPEGYAAGDLFASCIHLHFAGFPDVLDHWLERCRAFSRSRQSGGSPP